MKDKSKKQVTAWLPVEIVEKFQQLYPYCLTNFIKRCIIKSLNNKQFFNSVFFDEV